ncbi:MAG: RsmE family RNA methyltransferase, partial [Planctomycetota bacterium]
AARIEPAPGEPGAALPWIEVAVAWPRPNRADDMLDRLAQLGVAAIRPLACAHAGPQGLPDDEHKRERALRVLREACKQSRRTWLPVLHGSSAIDAFASGVKSSAVACLDPDAGSRLADWVVKESAASSATRARPLVLCVGPEGGFDERERAELAAAGAAPVALAPHILRIETAAEAALAVAVGLLHRRA